jgi:hypothetical protein
MWRKLKIVILLHVVFASHGNIIVKDFIVQGADIVDHINDVNDGIVKELMHV